MFESFASSSRFDFVGRWYDSLTGKDKWIETEASSGLCSWQDDDAGAGDYHIEFVYQVGAEYFVGHFRSETVVHLGTKIAVRYKPSNPKKHYLSGLYSGREPLVVAVIGVGFLLWWAVIKLMSLAYY